MCILTSRVPDNLTCWGLPPPSSVIETSPLKVPVAVGVKVTVMVQDPPAPKLDPHVFV